MPTNSRPAWPSFALTDVFDVRSGLSKPASEFGSGFPFVTFKDVLDNYFLPEALGNLVQSSETERELCDVRRGDVFLTRTSETQEDLGMSSVALRDYEGATFNGFTKRLRPKNVDQIVPEYAAYYLRSPRFRSEMSAFSSLSTRASLNNDMLSRLQIVLPDRKTQEEIGYTLRALDEKIEQNRRTGRVLEDLAQSTFKAWFVDFEPVKAKIAGQVSFPGMPHAVFASLPNRLTDSSLGPLPEGWEVRPIGELVTVRGGGTPSTKVAEYWDDGIHFWATPKDLSGLQEPVLLRTSRRITDAGAECISSGVLKENTVLLSSRAPVGYTALAKVPVAVNQGFIAMTCDGPLPPHYALHWTRSMLGEIKSRASGTTFPEISKGAFRPIPALLPSVAIVQAFETFAASLFDLIETNARQAFSLEEMRDYLLPRLLSGVARVRA
ncbi:TPA: restriction endonuclease subunit S [Pseudomonas aeruginosa]|uniref:restriction endonuclease subunit S n=1 Tax=Pseudomonas aeruginosa TaxID=287 RepID=UPI0008FADB92|nr:restriction endonuclease subunit S [Pseudomonas aeruginosa]MBG5213823.1 restriction endonuclease subunit S [Pseudomonas aeruginosa]MBX5871631.1 restriction endonuclease subunit S [Pseudomonas aeruginosa]MCO4000417.1 restriction endonuclease subunit S [Pseudomonas aeruginosa]MCV0250321.1 restriction endonuclease subunit S [Pseudomonas aeruginosa]OPE16020.1 restriction endonuclease subunit S [Pseudomonas aeruginosa]